MKFLIGIVLTVLLTVNAQASGCDDSCWDSEEKILNQQKFYSVDFDARLNGAAVVLTSKDQRIPTLLNLPLSLSQIGGRWEPIHPKLLARIASSERMFTDISVMDEEITVLPNSDESQKFVTGRLEIKFTFDTGESISITYPSLGELIVDGRVRTENILPPFFPMKAK